MNKNNMKEKCFAYQNKKTQEWLKIYPYWNGVFEFYDYFDKSVLYSARNIIEEDFSRIKLEDREDWQLMGVEIEYKFNKAEI
jgi:hypothetical protein